jgi:hypothetical protein
MMDEALVVDGCANRQHNEVQSCKIRLFHDAQRFYLGKIYIAIADP